MSEEKPFKEEDDIAPEFGSAPGFGGEFGYEDGKGSVDKVHYVELESWLGFKGNFKDLKNILRLRFKLMSYFMQFIKNPLQPLSEEHNNLLKTTASIMEKDHVKTSFQLVNDIHKSRFTSSRRVVHDYPETTSRVENKPKPEACRKDSEPIPADPAPQSQADSDSQKRPRTTNPSEIILAQLNQAQIKSRDDTKREHRSYYRPPKANRSKFLQKEEKLLRKQEASPDDSKKQSFNEFDEKVRF